MPYSLLLLCDVDDFKVLNENLAAHGNNDCEILYAANLSRLRELAASTSHDVRLISFLNNLIIPRDVLHSFRLGAYNFHPGSPEYPGTAPEAWACYDQVAEFGATLHEMTEKVDEGSIIDVELFPVPKRSHRLVYASIGRKMALALFCKHAASLVRPEPLAAGAAFSWSGTKRTTSDFQAMITLDPGITREELAKRLFCFGPPDIAEFTLNLHGYTFKMATVTGFKGYFDPIRDDTVQGWAINLSNPGQRMELVIKIDHDREFFVQADQYRADVHEAGYGDGFSGFTWPISQEYRDGLPHTIEVVALGLTLMGGPRLYTLQKHA